MDRTIAITQTTWSLRFEGSKYPLFFLALRITNSLTLSYVCQRSQSYED